MCMLANAPTEACRVFSTDTSCPNFKRVETLKCYKKTDPGLWLGHAAFTKQAFLCHHVSVNLMQTAPLSWKKTMYEWRASQSRSIFKYVIYAEQALHWAEKLWCSINVKFNNKLYNLSLDFGLMNLMTSSLVLWNIKWGKMKPTFPSSLCLEFKLSSHIIHGIDNNNRPNLVYASQCINRSLSTDTSCLNFKRVETLNCYQKQNFPDPELKLAFVFWSRFWRIMQGIFQS